MPILVEADTTTAGVLATALPAGSQVVARPEDVDGWLTGRGEYAVVIGPTLDMRTAAVAWPSASGPTHPATTVVLIRHELEPEIFARPCGRGSGPSSPPTTRKPWARRSAGPGTPGRPSRVRPRADGGDRNGRVFTVFSPKGGVGKTTMAVNLGLALPGGLARSAWSTSTSPSATSRSPCS